MKKSDRKLKKVMDKEMEITRYLMIFTRLFPIGYQLTRLLSVFQLNQLMPWLLSLMQFTRINLIKDSMFWRLLPEFHISHTFLVFITWKQLATRTILDGYVSIGLKDGTSFITCSSWKSSVEAKTGLTGSSLNILLFSTTGLLLSFISFSHHLLTIYQSKSKSMLTKHMMDLLSKMQKF